MIRKKTERERCNTSSTESNTVQANLHGSCVHLYIAIQSLGEIRFPHDSDDDVMQKAKGRLRQQLRSQLGFVDQRAQRPLRVSDEVVQRWGGHLVSPELHWNQTGEDLCS